MTQLEQRFYDTVPRRLQGMERCMERMCENMETLTELITKLYLSKGKEESNDAERENHKSRTDGEAGAGSSEVTSI